MCRKPSNGASSAEELCERDTWLAKFDFESFSEEIRALGKKLEAGQGEEDVDHLNKMILWSNACAAIGLLTMGFKVNIVTIFCLSTYIFTRWAMIAHHTCHGGYEKVHPNLSRWSRFKFALGTFWRRWNDWFDWMMPEAWNVEHNNRHHYNLGELSDPDLVENNLKDFRDIGLPLAVKYALVPIITGMWKWFYYAPNTYKELKLAKLRREGKKIPVGVIPEDAVTVRSLITEGTHFYSLWEFLSVVIGPYLDSLLYHSSPLLLLGRALGGIYWKGNVHDRPDKPFLG